MAVTGINEYLIKIDATTELLRRELQKGERQTQQTQRAMTGSVQRIEASFDRLNAAGAMVGKTLVGLFAVQQVGQAFATAGRQIVQSGDAMTRANAQLAALTGSAKTAAVVYEDLYRSSRQTGTAIEANVGAFQRFMIAAKDVGATRAEVTALVDGLSKMAAVAGGGAQETSAAIQQLGQALASGKLNGDELRSIMENMPTLAQGLARELGVGIGQLREMGEEGQLTADKVFPALLRATQNASNEFKAMGPLFSRSMESATIAFGRFTAEIDKALGLSQALARALDIVASQLDAASADMQAAPAHVAAGLERQRQALAAEAAAIREEITMLQEIEAKRGANPLMSNRPSRDAARLRAAEDALREIERQQEAVNLLVEAEDKRASAVATAEKAAARASKADAERRRALEAYNEVLKGLATSEQKAKTELESRIKAIDAANKAGAISDAEAARARADAEAQYREAITKSDKVRKDYAKTVDTDKDALDEYITSLEEETRLVRLSDDEREQQAAVLKAVNIEMERGNLLSAEARQKIIGLVAAQQEHRRALEEAEEAQRAAKQAQEEYAREVQRVAESVSTDVAESLWDSLTDEARGQSALEFFRRWAKRLAVQMLSQQIILPVSTAIVGGMPGLFGLSAPGAQGGGGAMGMLSNASSLYSAGNWASSLGNLSMLNNPFASVGQTVGGALGLGASTITGGWLAGSTLAGGSVAAGSSAAIATGMSGTSLGGFLSGSTIAGAGSAGAAGGAGAGAASVGLSGAAATGIGLAIAAVAIGAMMAFGNRKKHPAASFEGILGSGGEYYGFDVRSKHMGTEGVQQLGQQVGQIAKQIARFADLSSLNAGAVLGQDNAFFYRRRATDERIDFAFNPEDQQSVADAATRLSAALLQEGEGLNAVAERVVTALGDIGTASIETVREAVAFVEFFDGLSDRVASFEDAMDPRQIGEYESAILGMTGALAEQVTAINDQIKIAAAAEADVSALTDAIADMAEATEGAFERLFNPMTSGPYAAAIRDIDAAVVAGTDALEEMQRAARDAGSPVTDLAQQIEALESAAGDARSRLQGQFAQDIELAIYDMVDPTVAATRRIEQEMAGLRAEAISLGTGLEMVNLLEQLRLAQINDTTEALQSSISTWSEWQRRFRDFRQALRLDANLSPLTPGQRYAEARTQLEDVARRAALGDQEALGQLEDASRAFLESSRAYNASNGAFAADFDYVQTLLSNAETLAGRHLTVAQQQLQAAASANALLQQIKDQLAAGLTIQGIAELLAAAGGGGRGGGGGGSSLSGAAGYLASNPDVAMAAADHSSAFYQGVVQRYGPNPTIEQIARQHYEVHGQYEGRTGFATGGSFTVAGPSGVDNLSLPQLRLTAGEIVNVSRGDHMAAMLGELQALRGEVSGLRSDNERLMRAQMRLEAAAGQGTIARLDQVADATQRQAAAASLNSARVA